MDVVTTISGVVVTLCCGVLAVSVPVFRLVDHLMAGHQCEPGSHLIQGGVCVSCHVPLDDLLTTKGTP